MQCVPAHCNTLQHRVDMYARRCVLRCRIRGRGSIRRRSRTRAPEIFSMKLQKESFSATLRYVCETCHIALRNIRCHGVCRSVLQSVCCSQCFAVSVLQSVCCSQCVAVSVLQSVCCSLCVAGQCVEFRVSVTHYPSNDCSNVRSSTACHIVMQAERCSQCVAVGALQLVTY